MYSKPRRVWAPVAPALGRDLTDARLQLHHAAQFVACLGISYLPKADDDSHTSMEWFAGTLASHPVGPNPFRLGIRPHPLELVILVGDAVFASYRLNGRTIDDGAAWIRTRVTELGLDGDGYTLTRHYTLPPHGVARGEPFDATDEQKFAELSRWYADAATMLQLIVDERTDASPVRCWPHHFDIATLVGIAPDRTVGLGMEPGDVYYDEPYWYVTSTPPFTEAPPTIPGAGIWHTAEWTGAALPASRMAACDAQQPQVDEFLRYFLV